MTNQHSAQWQQTRTAIEQQPFMKLLGIAVDDLGEGWLQTSLQIEDKHRQHDGLVHGGVLATLADLSCTMAAHTQLLETQRVVTVEIKINFLRAVQDGRVRCRGEVLRKGRTLIVSEGKLYAQCNGEEVLVGVALATIAVLADNKGS